jgi:geranylgeranyl diphosphate synthase type II
VFHNFSLVHDDIMDAAPLRRGQQTVHTKWDINAGILSGDVMLVAAYQYFESYPPKLFKELVTTFSLTAQQVCEGQQMDVDFPQQRVVTNAQYLQMITYKTAVLLGCALKMGALIGGASTDLAEQWYAFGKNIGIAFQLQDDYLDAFGDPKTFGKQVGGDIIENKKTFLYLCALKNGNSLQTVALIDWFSKNLDDNTEKIQQVKEIFKSTGAEAATRAEIQRYTHKAFDLLTALPYPKDRLQPLKNLAEALIQRTT